MRLFGAGVLQLIDTIDDPWGGLVFLRSAPGGGKTTFLRLLTPKPLRLTGQLAEVSTQVKETREALRGVGAIDSNGSELLGVMVGFTSEYRDLAEFDRGNSLFRALLDSRIVIATLRAILDRIGRSYPDDLDKIRFEWEPPSGATIPGKAHGEELFNWASEIERNFYDRLDDLSGDLTSTGGHARLDALSWFARCRIYDRDDPIVSKRVLLLDELQTLAPAQRQSLTDILVAARETCGIWIAERLEALTHHDLLSEGALEDRDYEGVIELERQWASGRSKNYSKFVEQIAMLRALKADGFENRELFPLIADQDDIHTWGGKFVQATQDIERRIVSTTSGNRYNGWLNEARNDDSSALERAIRWRTTEILVERDKSRTQTSFDFDTLTSEEFAKRRAGVERAAEHFLRTELKAPIYFGRETLSEVSSSNVDQYLEVIGELFEEISAKISGPRHTPRPLTADRQDAIVRQVAASRWDGLARRLPRGYEAKRLLTALGSFCHTQTFRPTAPYAPGVTGFAITMQDRKILIDSQDDKIKHFLGLRDILTSLVAHNLLVPRLDHSNKNKTYVLFYLNRLLCVQFGLPLGYGGWREKSLKELQAWMETGDPQSLESATLV